MGTEYVVSIYAVKRRPYDWKKWRYGRTKDGKFRIESAHDQTNVPFCTCLLLFAESEDPARTKVQFLISGNWENGSEEDLIYIHVSARTKHFGPWINTVHLNWPAANKENGGMKAKENSVSTKWWLMYAVPDMNWAVQIVVHWNWSVSTSMCFFSPQSSGGCGRGRVVKRSFFCSLSQLPCLKQLNIYLPRHFASFLSLLLCSLSIPNIAFEMPFYLGGAGGSAVWAVK